MSSKNNVNVDYDKTKGRGRQGDEVIYDEYNRLRNQLRSRRPRGLSAKKLLARKRALRAKRQMENRNVSPKAQTRTTPDIGGEHRKQVSA